MDWDALRMPPWIWVGAVLYFIVGSSDLAIEELLPRGSMEPIRGGLTKRVATVGEDVGRRAWYSELPMIFGGWGSDELPVRSVQLR